MKKWLHPYILFGGVASILLLLAAVFTPILAPYAPDAIHLEDRYEPPSWKYPFGTDSIGRDVFSRVLYGTRISLLIGVSTRTMGLIIGVIIGAISGYFGGRVDSFLQRIVDITLAFPFLLLVISIAIIFTEGLLSVFIALSAVMWASMARLMRSQVLVVKTREYISAARAFGASNTQIIFRHIIPNCMVPALIWWTMGLAQAIMAEAGLSFLGLGAQPPTPSWGSMIHDGSQAIRVAPWISLFPGAALAFTVLAFNLFGEGLRELFDPKSRR
ncbi:MAG: ABC transporter permease [bacterium]|jgi:ABC-type dipeptide/oligopeptide/nickel transport system permease subunit